MCQPGPFACTLRSVGRTLQTRPGGGAMGVVGRGSLRQPRAVGPVTQRCRGDWLQGGAAWRELPLVARTGLGFPLSPHPLFRSRSLARVVWFCCWSEMVWFKDVQGCSMHSSRTQHDTEKMNSGHASRCSPPFPLRCRPLTP